MKASYGNTSLVFLFLALMSMVFADMAITALDPWTEISRLLGSVLRPDLRSIEAWSLIWTVSFAVLGVSAGAVCGFLMAIPYPSFATVRAFATFLRSVHELFWAILLMQVFGLGPLTGLLAIGLPFAGFFAKVYSEIIEEARLDALEALPYGTRPMMAFLYARLPDLIPAFKTYTLYRLECGLRSTLVLGFVGLPTIGFHLESYFSQGRYTQAMALLGCFYVLIGTRRLWARPATLPFLIIGSLLLLPESIGGGSTFENLTRFLGHDIVPAPLRGADLWVWTTWSAFLIWLWNMLSTEAFPGLIQTLILSQIALVLTAILALICFPLVSRHFAGRIGQTFSRFLLVIVRSTPEYMLAYVLLQLLGPSMLPAIIALSIHNSGIVAYLMGQHADALEYRIDAPRGFNLYAYETLPRLYGQFLAYMLYRWEIILRESAILGILGIATLGYFVDAAISELRFDNAVVLIFAMIALSTAVHMLSRWLRAKLRIDDLPTRLSTGILVSHKTVAA